MATLNWGMLEKSQVDPETIEEAIARLIAVHNADPTAHLGAGESLEAHKAEETIDHPASSVVMDKIPEGQITLAQMSYSEVQGYFVFNTVADWDFSVLAGTGAVFNQPFTVSVRGQGAGASKVVLKLESAGEGAWFERTRRYFFRAYVGAIASNNTRRFFGIGLWLPDSNAAGFAIEVRDGTAYLVVATGAVPGWTITEIELVGIDPTSAHIYEVGYDPDVPHIKVWVDGVLTLTETVIMPERNESTLFTFGIAKTIAGEHQLNCTNLLISFEPQ